MEISWTTAAPLIINLGALATVWWQLDSKMEKKIEAIDRKFDTMNTTLLTLTHDVGELKGQMSSLIHREDHSPGMADEQHEPGLRAGLFYVLPHPLSGGGAAGRGGYRRKKIAFPPTVG